MNATPWSLVLTVMLAIAAIGIVMIFLLRLGRAQMLLSNQLREARARSRCVELLLDVWLWQSDAPHRIVVLKPPHNSSQEIFPTQPPTAEALWQVFGGSDLASFQAMLAVAAPLDDVQVELSAAGAKPKTGILRARAHFDDAGAFAGYYGTFAERDAAAMSMLTAAFQHDQAAEKEQDVLSLTISHDLRAPVRVIEGFAKILKDDYSPVLGRVGNEHLDRVIGSASRMNDMIDALLGLSRVALASFDSPPCGSFAAGSVHC